MALADPCTSRVGSRQTTRDRLHALASIRERRGPSNPGGWCGYTRGRPAPGRVRSRHRRPMRRFAPPILRPGARRRGDAPFYPGRRETRCSALPLLRVLSQNGRRTSGPALRAWRRANTPTFARRPKRTPPALHRIAAACLPIGLTPIQPKRRKHCPRPKGQQEAARRRLAAGT